MGALLLCSMVQAQDGTDAYQNTRWGYGAMVLSCSPQYYNNTALGSESMVTSCGSNNTCVGANTMHGYGSGSYNSVVGFNTLYSNTSGYSNSAMGWNTLYSNTTGYAQVAMGVYALNHNTTGNYNVGLGVDGLNQNTTGSYNTAVGLQSLYSNTTGSYNTALGSGANVSSGTLSNATAIGYSASVNASNKIRLGNSSVTVVEGPVSYTVSDGRFKTNVSESDVKGLDFIKKLRPVVYNFDTKKFDAFLKKDMSEAARKEIQELDYTASTAIRQSGFIAQEVEKAAKEAGYNFNGVHAPENESDNYSLAYGQFVVPLVKAVQELSAENELLKKELAELKTLVKNITPGGAVNPADATESLLYQNSPNPVDQSTTIRFTISPLAENAVLTIVSINGQKVKEFDLTGRSKDQVEIHAGELAPGTYVYSLVVDGKKIDSKKMTLTK